MPLAAPSRFTGKERDAESGLDDFGARYYNSNLGRWITPDWAAKATAVPYATLANPQTLNLYAYVANNPTTLADIDGHLGTELAEGSTGSQDPQGSSGGSQSDSKERPTATTSPAQAAPEKKPLLDQLIDAIKGPAPAPPEPKPPGGPQLTPNLKPGVPEPPTGSDAGRLMQCTQSCLPVQIRVTSTDEPVIAPASGTNVHAAPDPHGQDKAIDVTIPQSQKQNLLQCAANCGAGRALDEYSKPSPNATAGHVHLQTTPGPGGDRGALPQPWPGTGR